MDSREALCTLFEIPKDEEIYESFTCQFHSNINSTGKLYCCENYLCFYASVMGVTVKNVTNVENVESAVVGEDYFEMTLRREQPAAGSTNAATPGKPKVLKYSKFAKETVTKALRLVAQILGEDKIQKVATKENPKEGGKEGKDSGKDQHSKEAGPMFKEVILDSFFGQEVREIVRVVFTNTTPDKVLGVLIGPKAADYSDSQPQLQLFSSRNIQFHS